jgi:hypothetical protein
MADARVDEMVETQGIAMRRDAAGMTQLRKLAAEVNVQEDSRTSPLMILRSERNQRRFELHYQGRMVLSFEPDGAMRLADGGKAAYEALRQWIEDAAAGRP